MLYVSVDSIQAPSFELRTEPEHADDPDFEHLRNSIRETGVIEPLVVRPAENGKYELIAGGRRLRAAMLAGLKEVPAIIKPALSDIDAKVLAIAENLHRKDLSPIEKSRALIALYESAGYSSELAAKYLMRLDEDNHRGEAKRSDAMVVPEHFKGIAKKLGLAANRQWQLLKYRHLDEGVLNYAHEKGLNGNKILLLTQKGIAERGVATHKRIIDRISDMSEWEAREYIHTCTVYANSMRERWAKEKERKEEASGGPASTTANIEEYVEVGPDTVVDRSMESAMEQDEQEEESAKLSRSEKRYARLVRDKDSRKPQESLAYLSVNELCLPVAYLRRLQKQAKAQNIELGAYLTYILFYKVERSGLTTLVLSRNEKAWFMSKNKGCATVKTEKEKEG